MKRYLLCWTNAGGDRIRYIYWNGEQSLFLSSPDRATKFTRDEINGMLLEMHNKGGWYPNFEPKEDRYWPHVVEG